MKVPMPSPKGTNHANLHLPEHWFNQIPQGGARDHMTPELRRRLARDASLDPSDGKLGVAGLARLTEFLKGKLSVEDFAGLEKLLEGISLDKPTDLEDDPHRRNENYAGRNSRQAYAGDDVPEDLSWAGPWLRSKGWSESDIKEFAKECERHGAIFDDAPAQAQAADAALRRSAASVNARFPNASRIGHVPPYGEPVPPKRQRTTTSAEANAFHARFPGAAKIRRV